MARWGDLGHTVKHAPAVPFSAGIAGTPGHVHTATCERLQHHICASIGKLGNYVCGAMLVTQFEHRVWQRYRHRCHCGTSDVGACDSAIKTCLSLSRLHRDCRRRLCFCLGALGLAAAAAAASWRCWPLGHLLPPSGQHLKLQLWHHANASIAELRRQSRHCRHRRHCILQNYNLQAAPHPVAAWTQMCRRNQAQR